MRDLEWKDGTAYSRNERGKVDPSTWSLDLGPICIVVTKHIHHGDTWTLYCQRIGIRTESLRTVNLEEAKVKAVSRVRDVVSSIGQALDFVPWQEG